MLLCIPSRGKCGDCCDSFLYESTWDYACPHCGLVYTITLSFSFLLSADLFSCLAFFQLCFFYHHLCLLEAVFIYQLYSLSPIFLVFLFSLSPHLRSALFGFSNVTDTFHCVFHLNSTCLLVFLPLRHARVCAFAFVQ